MQIEGTKFPTLGKIGETCHRGTEALRKKYPKISVPLCLRGSFCFERKTGTLKSYRCAGVGR